MEKNDLRDSKQSNSSSSDPHDEPAFAERIIEELQASGDMYGSPRDRLPPLWQILGAIILLIALVSAVVAIGAPDTAWHQRFMTGFLDGVLIFLGNLGIGMRNLWNAIMPGQSEAVLGMFTGFVTLINVGLCLLSIRRHRAGDNS